MIDDAQYARRIPDTDEIQSVFESLLEEAQTTFGPCEQQWERFRIELHREVSQPRTDNDGERTVTVWLNPKRSRIGYCFEIAHETVHCLNPISANDSTYLEEAVAVAFSLRMVGSTYGKHGLDQCVLSMGYREAIRRATRVNRDVIRLGQMVREHIDYGSLSRAATPETLRALYPDATQSVLISLMAKYASN